MDKKESTKSAPREKTAYSTAKDKFAEEPLPHSVSHSYPNSLWKVRPWSPIHSQSRCFWFPHRCSNLQGAARTIPRSKLARSMRFGRSPRQGPWFWRMCRHRRSNVDGTRRVSENGNHMVHTHNDDRTWLNVRQCLKFLNACIPFICPRTHVCTWEMCECGLPLQAALSFPNFFWGFLQQKVEACAAWVGLDLPTSQLQSRVCGHLAPTYLSIKGAIFRTWACVITHAWANVIHGNRTGRAKIDHCKTCLCKYTGFLWG